MESWHSMAGLQGVNGGMVILPGIGSKACKLTQEQSSFIEKQIKCYLEQRLMQFAL